MKTPPDSRHTHRLKSSRLVIKNIASYISGENLFAELTKLTDGLSSVLIRSPAGGEPRKCCLDFESPEAAAEAKLKLLNAELGFCGSELIVDWDDECETYEANGKSLNSFSGTHFVLVDSANLEGKPSIAPSKAIFIDAHSDLQGCATVNDTPPELQWPVQASFGKPVPHQKLLMVPTPGHGYPSPKLAANEFPHRKNVRIDSDEPDESTDEDELAYLRDKEDFLESVAAKQKGKEESTVVSTTQSDSSELDWKQSNDS